MAERSSDPILDTLIEEWLAQNPELNSFAGKSFGRLADMAYSPKSAGSPQLSTGHCLEVSLQFEEFINQRLREQGLGGVIADDVQNFAWADRETDYRWFGYEDHPESKPEADDMHTATMVQINQVVYAVDWTASQYGYQEFPFVQKYAFAGPDPAQGIYDRPPVWLRSWESPEIPPAPISSPLSV